MVSRIWHLRHKQPMKNSNWNSSELKHSYCKGHYQESKREPIQGGNGFQSYTRQGIMYLESTKKFTTQQWKDKSIPFKNGQRILNRHFSKEYIQLTISITGKNAPHPQPSWKHKIKLIMKGHFKTTKMTMIKKIITSVSKNAN